MSEALLIGAGIWALVMLSAIALVRVWGQREISAPNASEPPLTAADVSAIVAKAAEGLHSRVSIASGATYEHRDELSERVGVLMSAQMITNQALGMIIRRVGIDRMPEPPQPE
jgi:hypothetical protein